MRVQTVVWLSLVLFALAFAQGAQEEPGSKKPPKATSTTVAAILKEPDKFDKKWVRVEGTVTDLRLKTSQRGNDYTVFKLKDKEQTLTIFSYGHLQVKEDEKVAVTGKFFKERRVGSVTFKNEIDATPRNGGKVEKVK